MDINKLVEIASQSDFIEKVLNSNFSTTHVSCELKNEENTSLQDIECVFIHFLKARNSTKSKWAIGDLGLLMQHRGLGDVTKTICKHLGESYPRVSAKIRVCKRVPIDLRHERIPFTIYDDIYTNNSLDDQDRKKLIESLIEEQIFSTTQVRNKVDLFLYAKKQIASEELQKEFIALKSHPFAPSNEQGVVVLFGILADALNFRILHMQSVFPDCVAERITFRGRGMRKTERVEMKIEIQHKSSDFFRDKHDYTKCDALICWLNDTAVPPVGFEIIELKTELEKLKSIKPKLFQFNP
jgi:hypothetical protein